ncbi:hypothetical protein MBLNU459_g5223t1 [Dothideomycetes sp. NU459]
MSLFVEDDNNNGGNDSDVSVTSTVKSDADKEYDIEEIIHERSGPDGTVEYLVKWLDYPFHQSTYEPPDIFIDETIQSWEERKRKVALGVHSPFDEEAFLKSVEEAHAEKERQKARREAKRIRVGYYEERTKKNKDKRKKKQRLISRKHLEARSKPNSEDELQTVTPAVLSSKKKRKRSSPSPPPVSPLCSVNDCRASLDSLFDDVPESDDEAIEQVPVVPSLSAPPKWVPEQLPVTSQSASEPPLTYPVSASPDQEAVPPAALVDAPAKARKVIRRTSSVFTNWADNKKINSRPRVSGETPKDSSDPQFMNLSTRNRYQNYGVNEPPPNPAALNIVLGNTQPLKQGDDVQPRVIPPPLRQPPTAPAAARSPPQGPANLPMYNNAHFGLRQDEAERMNKEARISRFSSNHIGAPVVPSETTDSTPDAATAVMLAPTPSATRIGVSARLDIGAGPDFGINLSFKHGADQMPSISVSSIPPLLQVRHICTAADFRQYLFPDSKCLASGSISFGSDVTSYESFVERLLLNTAGAIVRHEHYLMLIYPMKSHDWDFLANPDTVRSSLGFHIQAPLPATSGELSASRDFARNAKPTLVETCEKLLGLDQKRLFDGAGKDKTVDRAVFLMFPSRKSAEVKLITAYLDEIGSLVYHADVASSWSLFLSSHCKSGVIIFHPIMNRYWEIPRFYEALFDGGVNIFQLGVDDRLLDQPDTAYSCVRLFAQSTATFITDDVIFYLPKLATDVFEAFKNKTFKKPVGFRNDRIVTRPGLKDWLHDLIQDQRNDRTSAMWWARISVILDKLTTGSEQDSGRSISDPEHQLVVSPPVEDLPEYPDMWERDEETATDWLVKWFAGYGIFERQRFRRFNVIHEQRRNAEQTPGLDGGAKDPRGWSKTFQHIRVTTPRRWTHHPI